MEFGKHSYKAIINKDCKSELKPEEFETLSRQFEPFELNGIKGLSTVVSFEPTYKDLTNRFRIPDEYDFNKRHAAEATALSEFMTIEEIKSISYLDYVGEHIHCSINQEKSWEAGDFEVCSSQDLLKVSNNYLSYCVENHPGKDKLHAEIKNLIELCEIAVKLNSEIWLYDGYFWQG